MKIYNIFDGSRDLKTGNQILCTPDGLCWILFLGWPESAKHINKTKIQQIRKKEKKNTQQQIRTHHQHELGPERAGPS